MDKVMKTGKELVEAGFHKPIQTAQTTAFYEEDGGVSELLSDMHGELHVFQRHGNDYFTYQAPLAEYMPQP